MSNKTVDEKVVEMRFDNKHFEKNVQTTLSTLDKLKQKLNLTGASKGLDNISKQADKVSFVNMENSLMSLEKRFSTMGIIGTTVIQNLTNSAMNFVKKISSFGINGIISGGYRRAQNIENARFQLNGLLKDAEKVAAVMKDVDYGVTETAYGLDAAATVAAQLVASGMEAGTEMRHTLRGISGVAAMTNSTYEDIGRIYTTVAGNGRLMGDQLLQLSARGMNAAATLGKYLNKSEAEVRQMVSKGQISFKMFSEAMDDAFGEHAKEANNTMTGALSNIKSALARIGELFFAPIIAEKSPLVQFLNSIRIRINEIKKNVVPIAEEVTSRINKAITTLNDVFVNGNVLGYNPFGKFISDTKKFSDTINGVISPLKKVTEVVNKQNESLKEYSVIVDEIISGKWGNAPTRYEELTKAGYDWAYAQNLVNEKLGSSVRHQTNYVENMQQSVEVTEDVTKSTTELVEDLTKLSEAQLKEKGYSDEQIEAIKLLGEVSNKTGLSVKQLLDLLDKDQFNTRFLLLNSFKNLGAALVSVLKSVAKAFGDVFNIKPKGLFDLIAAFHKLTLTIKNRVEKNADNLTRTLRGLFAIIHLITTFITGGVKIAFKILEGILSAFNISILDFTAIIGDAIYKFDRWITENNFLVESIKVITLFIKDLILAIIDWAKHNDKILNSIDNVKNGLKDFGSGIKEWVNGLKETDNIPKYILQGLANGLKSGANIVFSAIGGLANGIIELFKSILKIHSPSLVFFALGGFIIYGLYNGMESTVGKVFDFVKLIGQKIVSIVSELDLGRILAIAVAGGIFMLANKIVNIVANISKALVGLGDLFSGIGEAFAGFGKAMERYAFASIIKSVALGLVALAGAAFILSKIPADRLIPSLVALGIMAGAMVGIAVAVSKLSKAMDGVKFQNLAKMGAMLMGLSASLFALTLAVKILGGMKPEELKAGAQALLSITISLGILILAIASIGKITKAAGGADLSKVGSMLLKISIALLIIIAVIKLAGTLKYNEIEKGKDVIFGFGTFVVALIAVSKLAGEHASKAGSMILKISVALLIMIAVIKLAGTIKAKEIIKATALMVLFGIFVGVLIGLSKFAKSDVSKIGAMILEISASLLLLAAAIHLMGMLKVNHIAKAIVVIGLYGALIALMINVVKYNGKYASELGKMLLMISASLLLIVAAIFIIGQMDPKKLKRGLGAVAVLEALFIGIIAVTKYAKDCKDTLIMIEAILATLIGGVWLLAQLDENKLKLAGIVLGGLVAVVAGMMLVLKKLDGMKSSKGDVKKIAKIAGELLLLMVPLATLAGILAGLTWATQGSNNMIQNAIALTILMGAMSLILAGMTKLDGRSLSTSKISKVMLGLIALAAPMALYAVILSTMGDTKKAIQNTIALSLLMAVMTGLLAALTFIGKIGDLKSIGLGVLGLTAMALPLELFVLELKQMDGIKNATKNVKALIALATAMTLLLIPLTALGALMVLSGGTGALFIVAGVAALAAMAAPLAIFIAELQAMSGIPGAAQNAIILADFMEKMSNALVKISLISPLVGGAVAGIQALIIITTELGAFVMAIGALKERFPQMEEFFNKGLPVIQMIAEGLGSILGSLIKGAIVKASESLPELGKNLTSFMDNAKGFVDGVKKYDENARKGANNLALILLALMAENVIERISTFGHGESFARLGKELSNFAENADGFFTKLPKIDPESCKGAEIIAKTILILTAANFIENLSMLLEGIPGLGDSVSDLSDFASQFGDLGTGLKEFMENTPDLSGDDIQKAERASKCIGAIAEAAVTVANLNGKNFWGKLGELIVNGEIETLGSFASELGGVGKGLKKFYENVPHFTNKDVDTVKNAATVISAMSDAAGSIKRSIEVSAGFDGPFHVSAEKIESINIDEYLNKLPSIADKLKEITAKIGDFDDSKVEKVKVMTELMKQIVIMANASDQYSTIASFAGLKKLGEYIESLGTGLKNFINIIQGENEAAGITQEAFDSSFSYIKQISEIANSITPENIDNIKNIGEALNQLTSDNVKNIIKEYSKDKLDLTTFKENLTNIIDAFKSVFEGIKGYTEADINSLNAASDAIEKLTSINFDGAGENQNLAEQTKGYAKALTEFSIEIQNFIANMKGLEGLDIAITNFNSIKDLSTNITAEQAENLDKFGSALEDLSKNGASKFLGSFRSEESIGLAKEVIKQLMDTIAQGAIDNNQEHLINPLIDVIKNALESLNSATSDGGILYAASKQIGSNFGQGFINGINSKISGAKEAARQLGLASQTGLQEGADTHSPSKAAKKIGDFFGIGFINGLKTKMSDVFDQSYKLGDQARLGLMKTIYGITSLIENGIDDQPTIRPVLDLSDIENGVSNINSMFGNVPMDVIGNLNAISFGMSQNRQNGGEEVVSAIDRLRRDMSGKNGDTYNINGVTYDDGSEISEAVKTLVRAARIERRV